MPAIVSTVPTVGPGNGTQRVPGSAAQSALLQHKVEHWLGPPLTAVSTGAQIDDSHCVAVVHALPIAPTPVPDGAQIFTMSPVVASTS
jgi:hypothetical protein